MGCWGEEQGEKSVVLREERVCCMGSFSCGPRATTLTWAQCRSIAVCVCVCVCVLLAGTARGGRGIRCTERTEERLFADPGGGCAHKGCTSRPAHTDVAAHGDGWMGGRGATAWVGPNDGALCFSVG